MASSKGYLEFISEQLSDLEEFTYRPMMGEYILYYRGKVIGGIYDDRLLVKPTRSLASILPSAPLAIPYPGAKEMILIEDPEDRELLHRVVALLYEELPMPKKK